MESVSAEGLVEAFLKKFSRSRSEPLGPSALLKQKGAKRWWQDGYMHRHAPLPRVRPPALTNPCPCHHRPCLRVLRSVVKLYGSEYANQEPKVRVVLYTLLRQLRGLQNHVGWNGRDAGGMAMYYYSSRTTNNADAPGARSGGGSGARSGGSSGGGSSNGGGGGGSGGSCGGGGGGGGDRPIRSAARGVEKQHEGSRSSSSGGSGSSGASATAPLPTDQRRSHNPRTGDTAAAAVEQLLKHHCGTSPAAALGPSALLKQPGAAEAWSKRYVVVWCIVDALPAYLSSL